MWGTSTKVVPEEKTAAAAAGDDTEAEGAAVAAEAGVAYTTEVAHSV